MIDWTLQKSGWGTIERAGARERWIDCQPDFETAHYIKGFAYPDGKFRFKPDWPNVPFRMPVSRRADRVDADAAGLIGPIIEEADAAHPFRLATSPSRGFLNSTFNETPDSRAQNRGRPT